MRCLRLGHSPSFPMKNFLRFFIGFSVAAVAFAAEPKPIEETFEGYWSAYVRKDFPRVTADILPSDLEDTKAALLPVFLAAQTSKEKDALTVVTAFFGRTVGKARESLSPQEVFAALHRVTIAANPDFFEVLKEAKIAVVFVRTPDADNAEIHYQISIRGETQIEVDRLVKKDGRWWMRVKEDPRETAAQFKQMFGQGS